MRSIKHYITHPKDILLVLLTRTAYLWPDKIYLQLRFRLEMGKKLDLNNPKSFTEKIQWLKLNNRKQEYITMVDKYSVKDYVGKLIGKDYIIPLIGVWDKVDEIKFDGLPSQFVLKTTHGGGGSGVIVCRDKSKLDITDVKRKLNNSLKFDIYKNYREWPYKNVPRKIIAEQLLEIPDKEDLTDYKFFCFNGEPKYIQVIQDRNTEETIDFFDTYWNHQPFVGLNPKCRNANTIPSKPKKLEEMIEVARKLSKDIPFVRVDVYNIDSKVYFGELTFYPASGFGKFTPEGWDLKLGNMIKLPLSL